MQARAMKTLLALLSPLVFVVTVGAQTPPVPAAAEKDSVAPRAKIVLPGSSGSAPANTAAEKSAPKKAEPSGKEERKINGIAVPRSSGGFLGVEIVNATFRISFYDAKKVPIAPDAVRAILRWDPKYKIGKEQVVLNPGDDGKSLSSPKSIRPPYLFKLYITLVKDAAGTEESTGETYVIDFRA